MATRATEAWIRAGAGTTGLAGVVFLQAGINMLTDDRVQLGWILTIIGGLLATGGLASIVFGLVNDLRNQMTVVLRGSKLYMDNTAPGVTVWHLVVDLIIRPPRKQALVFQSDNITARITGLANIYWLEIDNMGISPSTAPVDFDGRFAELNIVRQMGVIVEGRTTLQTSWTVVPPQTMHYVIDLADASGEWSATKESDLHQVKPSEWSGFPDITRETIQHPSLLRWVPFTIGLMLFGAVLAWIAWSIIVKGWL